MDEDNSIMSSSEMEKRVADIRVVDLPVELDKHELDKTGVKPVIVERLTQENSECEEDSPIHSSCEGTTESSSDDEMSSPPEKMSKLCDETEDPSVVHLYLDAFTPCEEDKDGIVKLIGQLFRFTNLDVPLIVDEIINQNGVGSVMKDNVDAGGVMAICSVLFSKPGEIERPEAVFSLLTWMKARANQFREEGKEDTDDFLGILENSRKGKDRVGILLYDRIVNLSVDTGLAQLESLNEELVGEFDCEYLIVIERVYRDKETEELKYQLVEEELLESFVIAQISIPLDVDRFGMIYSEDWDGTKREGYPYRRIVVFKREYLAKFIEMCREEFTFQDLD